MKKFLTLALLAPLPLVAQQVQNVKATQTGESVVITYDLNDASQKASYVKLYFSNNGGSSYSDELRQVSGDIKANVKPGMGKKITWDASKELGVFEGDVVFKVEAASSGLNMPATVTAGKFSIQVVKAVIEGTTLKIDFFITNKSEDQIVELYFRESSVVTDSNGLSKNVTFWQIGTLKSPNLFHKATECVKDISIKGVATFDDFESTSSLLSLFKLDYNGGALIVKNIPITR